MGLRFVGALRVLQRRRSLLTCASSGIPEVGEGVVVGYRYTRRGGG